MSVLKAANDLKTNVSKVMVRCEEATDLIFMGILVSGHILLEDVPGTGKTMLAKSIAKSIDVAFKRIQFTPDLLPSDLIGINFYNQKSGEFEFRQGPLFSNVVLADEINRATPRTQSSLLEAMEEFQISVDGITHPLQSPFFVIATQNPVENMGTFPLPEAQLDRFTLKLSLGYLNINEEITMIKKHSTHNPLDDLLPVLNALQLDALKTECNNVFIHDEVLKYMLNIVDATRNHSGIALGVSTRGALVMVKCLRTYAAIQGRDYVLPDDVKALCPYVFAHRIIPGGYSYTSANSSKDLLNEIINSIKVPSEDFTIPKGA